MEGNEFMNSQNPAGADAPHLTVVTEAAPPLVLVIDDDEQFRGFVVTLLKRQKYRVLEAPNGLVGLRLFKDNPVDLVITDIMMPEKEGIETVLDILRSKRGTKIIAMSGSERDGFDALNIVRKFGVDTVLSKPFDNAEFLGKVRGLTTAA